MCDGEEFNSRRRGPRGAEYLEENTKCYCKEAQGEDDRNDEPDVKLRVREKLNEPST